MFGWLEEVDSLLVVAVAAVVDVVAAVFAVAAGLVDFVVVGADVAVAADVAF